MIGCCCVDLIFLNLLKCIGISTGTQAQMDGDINK
jgi:hypothetical protein